MFGDDIDAAKAICTGCPVATECLRAALDCEAEHGVWAGTTRDERLGLCPECLGPKPRSEIACNFPHILLRTARLVDLMEFGTPDVEVVAAERPTQRTSAMCPLPKGRDHASVRAYNHGRCRCAASREAVRVQRLERGTHARVRGPYFRRTTC